MVKAKVNWFNDKKGFGFLFNPDHPDSTSIQHLIFVHHSVVEKRPGEHYATLVDGEIVEVEFEKGTKGFKATKVVRLAASSTS